MRISELYALQEGDIAIAMLDLNGKMVSDNIFRRHVMERYGFDDSNNNVERFVKFCNVHHLVVDSILFE